MTDDTGGFYSAEDADSVPPGSAEATRQRQAGRTFETAHPHKMEGAFYVWAAEEIRTQLGDAAPVFEARYGILPNGNAPFDPQQEFVNKNLLYTAQSITDIARLSGKTPFEVAESLLRSRKLLFDVRELRPRPQLDDKVLTAWNGLMIAAFARASRVLMGGALGQENTDIAEGTETSALAHLLNAVAAAAFIRHRMWDGTSRRLLRRYRAGDAAIDGLRRGLRVPGVRAARVVPGHRAIRIGCRGRVSCRRARMNCSGTPTAAAGSAPPARIASVLLRMKEDYDGAEPSPSSVAALNVLTLAHLTGERAYADRAAEAMASFGGRLEEQGRAVPMMAAALETSLAGGEQIVIVGHRDADDTSAMWRAAHHALSAVRGDHAVRSVRAAGPGRAHALGQGHEDDRRQGHGLRVPRLCV